MKNKRALIIANKVIFPSTDGGSMAMKNLANNLTILKYQLDIVTISKQSEINNKQSPTISSINKNIKQIVFKKKMSLNIWKIIISLFSNESYQANRFYSKKIKKFIQSLINKNKYNIIIFESVFSAIYLKKLKHISTSPIILRAHNIEHQIWQDLAKSHFIKKIIFSVLAKQIRNMEENIHQYVNHIFTLAPNDYQFYKKTSPTKTHNLPVTFEIKNKQLKKINNSIVHLGAMDWQPNREGMNWFLKHVLPKIQKNNPKIITYIGGKQMPKSYYQYQNQHCFIDSNIPNGENYIANKAVMFVPLFSGSGIRIKILESMSLGVPVVSTSKGAEGIPYIDGENILIGNNPNDFYNAICLLLNNKELANKIAKNGQQLIKKHFSKEFFINQFQTIIK